ncbi:type 11 methyltransferase [Kalymmatonema gypsitolerans NIES-4073]|nr:type 11 methyltransferase [Scytonema sp. NIES-4073]
MKCNICEADTKYIFTEKVLFKYDVKYYRCTKCKFIQTETPYWLEEAYKDPIAVSDVGMVQRGILWKPALERIIRKFFNVNSKFVDYGGGTGLLVRLMRDAGFDFYRYDPYSSNIFARGFDVADLQDRNAKFDLLTAFEVFEHIEKPLVALEEMFKLSDSILFSTLLQPSDESKINAQDWKYFAPQTGQHIAFYTKDALNEIASKFGCYLYSDDEDVHLLTSKKLNLSPNQMRNLILPGKKQRISEFLRSIQKPLVKIPEATLKDAQFILEKFSSVGSKA